MFELAMPWVLIILPIPLLVQNYVASAKSQSKAALILPHFHLLMRKNDTTPEPQSSAPLWLSLSWVLLVFATSGPRWIGEPLPLHHEGHNIMLALDISGSMAIDDMVWKNHRSSRLSIVKHAATTFVKERPNDKIGLILFGTRAYLQTPLTEDKHTILVRLFDASVGLAGNSTSLGDAIGLAIKHLENTNPKGRVIILLTDGANNSGVLPPQKAAELARDNHIKIYTIGLGSDPTALAFNGLYYPSSAGADLDEEALTEIASTTHGQYFRATDLSSLQQIYKLINQMETVEQEQIIRPQHDYYPWPLAIALCLILGGLWTEAWGLPFFFRRKDKGNCS